MAMRQCKVCLRRSNNDASGSIASVPLGASGGLGLLMERRAS
jgi:hypothetical protein